MRSNPTTCFPEALLHGPSASLTEATPGKHVSKGFKVCYENIQQPLQWSLWMVEHPRGKKKKNINHTIWWDELCTIIARQIFLLRGRVVYSLFCCFFFFSLLCKQIFTQVFVAMTEEAALALVGWMEGRTEPADSCTWWSFCVPSKEGSSTFLGSAKWGRLYSPHLGPAYLEEDLHELY